MDTDDFNRYLDLLEECKEEIGRLDKEDAECVETMWAVRPRQGFTELEKTNLDALADFLEL